MGVLFNLDEYSLLEGLNHNAAWQIFCGRQHSDNWKLPDRSRVVRFRQRLEPETHRKLANALAVHAVKLGLASPESLDVDSTIQKANITPPTAGKFLLKLTEHTAKIAQHFGLMLDKKKRSLKQLFCRYSFTAKTRPEQRKDLLIQYGNEVYDFMCEVFGTLESLPQEHKIPWNIKKSMMQLKHKSSTIFNQIALWVMVQKFPQDTVKSLHLNQVECFNKGHDKAVFGRAYQLGRMGGNFMIVGECDSIRMEDGEALPAMMECHESLFGKGSLQSIAADKKYHTVHNLKDLESKNIAEVGIGIPRSNKKTWNVMSSIEIRKKLRKRRAGIEPMIGHLKHKGQMGRSRMKTDRTTLASGYSAVLGLNLRQLLKQLRDPFAFNPEIEKILA